jgi:hypothetical protein
MGDQDHGFVQSEPENLEDLEDVDEALDTVSGGATTSKNKGTSPRIEYVKVTLSEALITSVE